MKKLIPILLIIVFLQMSCFNIISFAVQETVKNELQENVVEEDKPSPTSEIEAPTEEPEDIEAEQSEKPSPEPSEVEEQVSTQEEEPQINTMSVDIDATQELENGAYEIYTSINSSKVLDLDAGNLSNCANIQIWERTKSVNQEFTLTKNEDGKTYTIISKRSGKALDVANGGMTNYTNVWQYQPNGTDAQKWYLKPSGDGSSYNIVSALNGLCLDIYGGSSADGTNVQVYQGNGTAAQKFKIVKCQPTSGQKTVEEGIYNIKCKVADDRLLEVCDASTSNTAEIRLGANNNKASQKFDVKFNEEDGTYTIKAVHSGLVLDVRNASTKIGAVVQQYSSNNSDAQKWIIDKDENGDCTIISKSNGLVLDVQSGSSAVGARIQTFYSNKTNAQKFVFDECEPLKPEKTVQDGTYRIMCMNNLKQVFDIDAGSVNNGALLQTWSISNVEQQSFKIESDEQGYYKITSKLSNKALTVESESPQVGSKVTQQDDNNLETQKWILKKYSENVYGIVSKCGELYIDSSGAKDGQKIQLKGENDLAEQQFILIEENPQNNISTELEDGVYQIATKGNNTVIDISAGSQDNSANVQIWQNTGVQQQKFYISKIEGTNYYKMTAMHSGKVLDVSGGNKNAYANVAQYSYNGTNSQMWLLKKSNEDGWFNIISTVNWLCLDVYGGTINASGSNIHMYYPNGSEAQKFKFNKVNAINNGTYEIETRLNSNDVVDVSAASQDDGAWIQLWEADNVDQQRFTLETVGWNTYKIAAKHSNKVLAVGGDNYVYQQTYNGSANQQWEILPAGDGYYFLLNKENNKVLDVYDGRANNGQRIWTYPCNGSVAQQFRFVTGRRLHYEEGVYGYSGYAVINDWKGTGLKYYKIGKGPKVLFTTFSIHGFEDSYAHDGAELTHIANEFNNYLRGNITDDIIRNWTIYIFPELNPDGQVYGWTNNGPGRCTVVQGIDMNRNWSEGYKRETSSRYYNGTGPFQAYEVNYLREFILGHRGTKNILVDVHGWMNETIGDNGLGAYYRNWFGLPAHVSGYGSGYLINWARTIGNARSVLVELPQVGSHAEAVQRDYAWKFTGATLQLINEN